MALLVDKYSISKPSDVVFNKDIYNRLLDNIPSSKKLEEEREFYDSHEGTMKEKYELYKSINKSKKKRKYSMIGNLIIHGFNKSSLVKIMLQELYGQDVHDMRTINYEVENSNSKDKIIEIPQSLYHIVITANGTTLDKLIIQHVVDNYASIKFFITDSTLVPFKIILIKNADKLSTYAQASLRRTMENNCDTCRFVLCVSETSKIIDPIRSRCLHIRIPKPQTKELLSYIATISKMENINASLGYIKHIVDISNRDVKTALWWLQHYKYKIKDMTIPWKNRLNQLIGIFDYIYKKKKVVKLTGIMALRSTVNELLLTNIPYNVIISELLFQIISQHPEYPHELQKKIISIFFKYEYNLVTGIRHIIHIETMYIELCKTLYEEPL